MEPIRIVLAEDHTLVREGTRHMLEQCSDLTVVGTAEDGDQALGLIRTLQPDVAILDIRMGGLSGIEVVRRMSEYCSTTKALILTAYDDDDYVLALMEAGALGSLLKTAQPAELIEGVRSVHQGEPVLHPATAMKVARLWAKRTAFGKSGNGDQLTPRELDVLDLAAKGLRNKAIAENLQISVRTVEGHFNNIFFKMNVSSRTEAVLSALSQHLVVPDDGHQA